MVAHQKAFRKLNRTSAHRRAMLRTMVTQLERESGARGIVKHVCAPGASGKTTSIGCITASEMPTEAFSARVWQTRALHW